MLGKWKPLGVGRLLAAAVIAIGSAGAAAAATVTVNWTGEITVTGQYTGISVGDTITGSYSYDSTSPADPLNPGSALRQEYATGHTSFFTLGARSGSFSNQNIFVILNSSSTHQFDTRNPNDDTEVYSGSLFDGATPEQLFVRFNDFSSTAFADNALPSSLDPGDFTFPNTRTSRIDFAGMPDVEFQITGFEVDGTVAPVPLPATLPLALIALGGLALVRRRIG